MKLLNLFFILFTSIIAFSQTFYINSLSGNDSNNGSQASPFKTFTKAYNSLGSANNETLNKIIAEGTFDWSSTDETGEGTGGFVLDKNLTIQGLSNAQNTIFQPASTATASTKRVFQIALTRTVIIDKCTIRFGNGTTGGGIENYGVLYVSNSIITDNKASSSGAGIDTRGFCKIENSQISYNVCSGSTGMGAGVNRNYYSPSGGSPTNADELIIINSTINNNTVTASTGYLEGGGVFFRRGVGTILNCTITKNTCSGGLQGATHGLGVGDPGTNVKIQNSIIAGNTFGYWGGDLGARDSQGTITDLGGNIIGTRGAYVGYYALSSPSSLSWYDTNTNGGALDDVFNKWNTSTSGTLALSSSLSSNGSTNGMTFSIPFSSVAIDNGISTTVTSHNNLSISVPTTDQRQINRTNNDVGAFEGQFITWVGSNTNPSVTTNWSPTGLPTSTSQVVISNSSAFPNFNSPVTFLDLNITSGSSTTIQSTGQLTVTNSIINNGTLILESGATLVQGVSSTLAGSGTYNVKQAITGDGTSTPSGRFWYLGSPVATASSSVFFASNSANVVKKRNEATNAWTVVQSGTPENLSVGRGYYTQAMANSTVTFTGGNINNGTVNISNLSRTSGVNFEGFNLVANPYPSYLDWDLVTKTNVGNTMWYRTATGNTAGAMVFETYVAGAAGGIGTNLSGNVATKLIPPMQAFWVRVNQGQTTGSLTLNNSMRTHFSSISGSTAGLRSTNDELKVFLRMNLLQEDKKDQLIVYMNGAATNGFDILDGEKMMQAGYPQFYTKAGDKKIVINGLNSAKKQQSLPITMELPTTGVHSFIIEDLEISNGLVWLEDKQEEIIQALEPGTVYEFYAASGMNAERFVLHFQLIDDAVPTNAYNEVSSSANFNGKGANVHAEAAGVVVIKLPASTEGVTDIQIRDAAGRIVYTGSTNTLETSVQLSQANGIYYVTLNSNAGVEVRKVFIQQ